MGTSRPGKRNDASNQDARSSNPSMREVGVRTLSLSLSPLASDNPTSKRFLIVTLGQSQIAICHNINDLQFSTRCKNSLSRKRETDAKNVGLEGV
jgi:hypothetical protein